MAPDLVSPERYTSPDFARREHAGLWPHAWQMACRLEELAAVGDYVEYQIADQSVLVVRSSTASVEAFHNSCRHRSTRLATGTGSFLTGTIRCPLHQWTWDLDGTNSFVLDSHEFEPALDPQALRLRPVRCETAWGFVFVNFDQDASSLYSQLGEVVDLIDPLAVDRMRFHWYKTSAVRANWKTAIDQFTEAYHVPTVHHQLGIDHNAYEYNHFEGGHQHYALRPRKDTPQTAGDGREILLKLVRDYARNFNAGYTERELHIAEGVLRQPLPDGVTAPQHFAAAIRAYAEGAGYPMPTLTADQVRWFGVWYVFPNLLLVINQVGCLVYRARPHGLDPDECIWDAWNLRFYASGEEPSIDREMLDVDDERWPFIIRQDLEVLAERTVGLHSWGAEAARLNPRQETGTLRMHQEIDNYLDATESSTRVAAETTRCRDGM